VLDDFGYSCAFYKHWTALSEVDKLSLGMSYREKFKEEAVLDSVFSLLGELLISTAPKEFSTESCRMTIRKGGGIAMFGMSTIYS
jgi:hypothetical protein